MNSESLAQFSPLALFYTRVGGALSDENAGVTLQERAFLGHINLRGNPADSGFLADTKGVLGFSLPLEANTWAGDDDLRACWLGPNEWLLLSTGDADVWADKLRRANGTRFTAVTVISGGQTVLRLSGDSVRDVFAKGCTLDFHPRVFACGQCAQSTLGKAPALYIQIDDAPVYEVVVRRSFADYIGYWLEDAAHEFGLFIGR